MIYTRERKSNVLNEDKRQHTLQVESTNNQLLSMRKAEEVAFMCMFDNLIKLIKSQMGEEEWCPCCRICIKVMSIKNTP